MRKLLIIILISLSGCSASGLIRRAIKKDPSIFKSDTTVLIDTVITKGASTKITIHDTLFFYKDTVIYQDKIKIEVVRDTITGIPEIIIDCPEDSTFNTTTTVTDTVIVEPKKESWFKRAFKKIKGSLVWTSLLVVCIGIIILIIKK